MQGRGSQRSQSDDNNSVSTDYTPFPVVLYEMLMTESKLGNASPVRWVCKGEAFVVENLQPQLNAVLRKYFNHGKYASLQRQLNMYGWKKHFSGRYEGAFHHPWFRKDKTDGLDKIKRKPPPGRVEKKLGTRKRKVRRRSSEASESSSLLREAALVKTNGHQETYYYGSDISTANDNSTLGDDQDLDLDNYNDGVVDMHDDSPRPRITHITSEGTGDSSGRLEETTDLQGDDIRSFTGSKEQAKTNKIVLPFALKKIMISTWENINQRQMVPKLPAAISVKKVLDMYVEAKISLFARQEEQLANNNNEGERIKRMKAGSRDMAEGIALFFDKALESRLLYSEEMPQWNALKSPDNSEQRTRPSNIYGCEHLLRLLLRLPDILSECVSDGKRKRILQDIVEFVRFLQQRQETLFTASFRKLTEAELDCAQERKRL